jgi:hypothetical protein
MMARKLPTRASWLNLTMLAAESSWVVFLRAVRLAAGGTAARREAKRMMTEKAFAAAQATASLIAGRSPNAIVKQYRRKVRSNIRRLSK